MILIILFHLFLVLCAHDGDGHDHSHGVTHDHAHTHDHHHGHSHSHDADPSQRAATGYLRRHVSLGNPVANATTALTLEVQPFDVAAKEGTYSNTL
jgi:ABC-type Zn2+ transport system substrate-binding protein/surface adhesin